MDYCGPLGIPHSVFLGWSELDQDKALAWQRRKNSLCHHCGTNPDDWLADGRRKLNPPWVADSYRCWGCVELDEKNDEVHESGEKGVRAILKRVDPA